jgi:hypothetical protein
LNLLTSLDSTGKTWTITGQAENIAAAHLTKIFSVDSAYWPIQRIAGVQTAKLFPAALPQLVPKFIISAKFPTAPHAVDACWANAECASGALTIANSPAAIKATMIVVILFMVFFYYGTTTNTDYAYF